PPDFRKPTADSVVTSPAMVAYGVSQQWEAIKAEQRKSQQPDTSILADVPLALTALLRANKLQKRVSRHALDWPNASEVMDKLEEELSELKVAIDSGAQADMAEEFGDLLFTVVNLGRHLGDRKSVV